MNAEENTPVEYNGRKYTRYEALQRQRRLETVMRAERQRIKLLEDGGADERDVIAARAKYRGTSHEYATFSKAMGLPQQRERVTVDGLGNIGVGKYKLPVDKSGRSGIITGRGSGTGNPANTDHTFEKIGETDFSDEIEQVYIDCYNEVGDINTLSWQSRKIKPIKEEDYQHEVVMRVCEKFGVKYERKRKA